MAVPHDSDDRHGVCATAPVEFTLSWDVSGRLARARIVHVCKRSVLFYPVRVYGSALLAALTAQLQSHREKICRGRPRFASDCS